MPRPFTKRLVIDASVARAAGPEDAVFPTAKNCRDFLQFVLQKGHRFVMTPEIREEWGRHQSGFARRWRTAMVQKDRQVFIEEAANDVLRREVDEVAASAVDCAAMQKDVHLIESAVVTDRTVISLDDVVRKLFAETSVQIDELGNIVWTNPDKQQEKPIEWVKQGAKPDEERRLRFRLNKPCPYCSSGISALIFAEKVYCSACHKWIKIADGTFDKIY